MHGAILTGVQRRRRWSTTEKIRLVEESQQPGSSVSLVARRYGLSPSLLFSWKRRVLEGGHQGRASRRGGRWRELERRVGVRLQLSGHTHGGMIRGLDRLVARGKAGFVSGVYRVGGMLLYVSSGTALWPGFALRLGRPSKLTRITLRASS